MRVSLGDDQRASCSAKMRQEGLRRISRGCRVAAYAVVVLITIAPRVPSQRMWTRRGLVHRIGSTRPANATHGGQALFKCFPPAIRGTTAMPKIVIGAPRIVSRLSGSFDADDGCESAHDY